MRQVRPARRRRVSGSVGRRRRWRNLPSIRCAQAWRSSPLPRAERRQHVRTAEPRCSGSIASAFQRNALTPLLALVLFLMGVFATLVTPKEEEPQIDVTMANVLVPSRRLGPGCRESLVSTLAEQVLSRMAGVKHVYSVSQPGMAVVTVEFRSGCPTRPRWCGCMTPSTPRDWVSPQLGVGDPIIKPHGIDDVPIVSLTLGTPMRRARLRPSTGGAGRRDRTEAYCRYPRCERHHRWPGACDPGSDEPERMSAFGVTGAGSASRPAAGQCVPAGRQPGARQPGGAGADRHLHRIGWRRGAWWSAWQTATGLPGDVATVDDGPDCQPVRMVRHRCRGGDGRIEAAGRFPR